MSITVSHAEVNKTMKRNPKIIVRGKLTIRMLISGANLQTSPKPTWVRKNTAIIGAAIFNPITNSWPERYTVLAKVPEVNANPPTGTVLKLSTMAIKTM